MEFKIRFFQALSVLSFTACSCSAAFAAQGALICEIRAGYDLGEKSNAPTKGTFTVTIEYSGEDIEAFNPVFEIPCTSVWKSEATSGKIEFGCSTMLGNSRYDQSLKIDRYSGEFVKFFGAPDASSGLITEGVCKRTQRRF